MMDGFAEEVEEDVAAPVEGQSEGDGTLQSKE